ncbi:MAG: GAF domain-containing sensor histidine kinase [Dehalococcoidia bacterium]|nr:GAF domain-containing sensor histidine kinase [Dehalococcoidia bacterium]
MRSRSRLFGRLSLRQLELLAIVAPMIFLAAVYVIVLGPVHPVFHHWPGFVLLAVILGGAVWFFTRAVFGAVRLLQREVEALSAQTERHNQQLMQLHGADLALMRETRVEEALRRIVELGARLAGACHAALVLGLQTDGARILLHPEMEASAASRCALEAAMRDGSDLVAAPRGDDRVLAVVLSHLGTSIGTLYLARRADAAPFTAADEEVARMFATHGAMVVENDRLYDEVRALAIESERQALAREMHDSLAQVLAFVNAKAQAVELYLRSDDVTSAREQMAELSAAAREVYADIREGISALRVEVAGRTLGELIGGYASEFGESAELRIDVDWNVASDTLQMPPSAEVQLLRIVQEALANVRRHAGATRVRIRASVEEDCLDLSVVDDGRGFAPHDRASDGRPRFGLQTMAERAKAIGGTLKVESAPEHGTTVRVRVPVPVHAAHDEAR